MKKNKPEMEIWDTGTEFQALPFEKANPASNFPDSSGDGIRKEVLCRPDGEYGFLHDCAVISFKGTLFAAWYNCPEGEMVGKSVIRGRRSEDGGKTWSEIFTLAGGDGKNASPAGKRGSASLLYVPPAFLADGDNLYLIVSRMTGPDLMEDFEIFRWEEPSGTFRSVQVVDKTFLPNTPGFRMKNGKWIIGGRWTPEKGTRPECPAVAVCDSGDPEKEWRIMKIHDRILPDGSAFLFPETGLWVEDDCITAFVRNDHGAPLLFRSRDCGESWEGPFYHNLPLAPVKAAAGILPDGRRYVIGNPVESGRRTRLMIAWAAAPGEMPLSRALLLQCGDDAELKASPEWSYPSAWVAGGDLYVIYTSAKTSAVMAVIPLRVLR